MQTIENIDFSRPLEGASQGASHDSLWQNLLSVAQSSTSDWKWREPFFKAAQKLGMPKVSPQGAYAGVKMSLVLKQLEQACFSAAPINEIDDSFDMVFSAGKLMKKPSWPCMGLDQMQRHPVAQQRYKAWVEQEKDSLALLNGALAKEAVFCRLPDGFKGKIRLLFDAGTEQGIAASRLTLWVGAGSHVQVECLSVHSGSSHSLSLDLVDIVLEASSHVEMNWQRADKGLGFSFLRASLMKEARLDFIDLSEGALVSRLDAQVKLMQEGAFADLRGLALLSAKQQNQTNVRVEHVAPSCQSSQLFKALLKDHSRSHFQGKIYVFPQAQKTQAYQISRNLLLGEGAQAQSCPNLEIFADDVKASHGSATGPVDPESLFYLLSRGIDKDTATGLLSHGFALDVLASMTEGERLETWKAKVMRI